MFADIKHQYNNLHFHKADWRVHCYIHCILMLPQCRQFRYIALELCSATLEDYIQGRFKADISTLTILYQATSGLKHLHNLDIG